MRPSLAQKASRPPIPVVHPKPESVAWYAVRVRSCAEFIVAAGLRGKDLDTFLPVYESSRRWSDRKKIIQVPLFLGMSSQVRGGTQATGSDDVRSGEHRLVRDGARAGPRYRDRIDSENDRNPNPAFSKSVSGGRKAVEVVRGPLSGVIGTIAALKSGWRLVVSVHLLQRSIAVEVDTSMVEPCVARASGSTRPSDVPEQVFESCDICR